MMPVPPTHPGNRRSDTQPQRPAGKLRAGRALGLAVGQGFADPRCGILRLEILTPNADGVGCGWSSHE